MKLKQRKLSLALFATCSIVPQIFLFVMGSFPLYAIEGRPQGLLNHGNLSAGSRFVAEQKTVFKNKEQVVVTVTGYVYDDAGQPLPGASVTEKGLKNGTNTDEKGFFNLKVTDANAVLIIRSMGFEAREIRVGNQTNLKVTLKTETSKLTEVVVVGYGTQKKLTSTGAVSTIGTKELVQSPVANISNSLVGRLPGLFATQGSGEPGNDASTLRIRGVGTFNGNADPLVLVDGIQVENFNNIDPNEIESLSILKDASATAVYGIRGANGVIIITTKRGSTGKPQINYTFNMASNSFTDLRKSVNSFDYATAWNKGIELDRNAGSSTNLRWTAEELEKFRTGSDPIFYSNTDWYNLMLKDNSGQSHHNLQVRGGQQKVKYAISAGIFNQEGLFTDFTYITKKFDSNTTYKRYNFRSNFDFNITKNFKLALDVSAQTENRKGNNVSTGSSTDFGTSRIIGDIARAAPLSGPGVVGDLLVDSDPTQNNPLKQFLTQSGNGGIKRIHRNNVNGTVKADYLLNFITKGLATHGSVSLQTFNFQTVGNQISVPTYQARRFDDGTVLFQPLTGPSVFQFTSSGLNRRRAFASFSVDYNRSFGNHNVSGLVLYDQQKNFDPELAFSIPRGYQSLVGRVTYNYKRRYLADFNGAYNGTENFAPGRRFGFFPAGSIGWIPSEESFFPKTDIISFVKIRASYGLVGNDQIGGSRFLYNPTSYTDVTNIYSFGAANTNYARFTGSREGITGNPDVTWERVKKANLALETIFFKNKLKVTTEVFDNRTTNILASPQSILAFAGLQQPAVNLGRMNNKGYEADITFTDRIGEDFDYRISGNYSFARNKVIFRDEVNTVAHRRTTGQRLGQLYGLIADGLYNSWEEVNAPNRAVYENFANVQPGDIRYRDIDGNGIINQNDQVPIGYSRTPEKTYGFSLYGRFKGLDMSLLFQGVGNVSVAYTGFQRSYGWLSAVPAGTPEYLLESWTPERYAEGLPINFPRFSASNSFNPNTSYGLSSFYIQDASYLRLKNVELGYRFNAPFMKKMGTSSLRLYLTANNLITWSKVYQGIDPENNIPRNDANNEEPYPLVRTFNAGINVNF